MYVGIYLLIFWFWMPEICWNFVVSECILNADIFGLYFICFDVLSVNVWSIALPLLLILHHLCSVKVHDELQSKIPQARELLTMKQILCQLPSHGCPAIENPNNHWHSRCVYELHSTGNCFKDWLSPLLLACRAPDVPREDTSSWGWHANTQMLFEQQQIKIIIIQTQCSIVSEAQKAKLVETSCQSLTLAHVDVWWGCESCLRWRPLVALCTRLARWLSCSPADALASSATRC